MTIRPLMPRDITKLVELSSIMHAEGNYKEFNFNPKKLAQNFLMGLANLSVVGFVDEKNNNIVGAIVGYITDYFFGDDTILHGYGLYVLESHRKTKSGARLLEAFKEASKNLGVKEVSIENSNMEDPNTLDLLCKKVGFKKLGSIYKIQL